ncbi:MAG: APC family permease, partial [Blastocatellia bacterium]
MIEEKNQLIRGLTLTGTTALVIGTVIGTGVFLKAAPMAQEVGTPTLVLVAWVAAGLLTLAGALTYAELGAMLPHAGGEYVYLRHSYGDASAFLFGWQRFIVAGSASIASLGAGFAIFLSAFLPLNQVWAQRDVKLLGQTINWQFGSKQVVAVAVILLLSALNCLTVAFGGKVQSVLTVLKVAGLALVIGGVFFFAPTVTWSNLATPAGTPAWSGFAAFGVAMLAALWAYDGWNNMPMAAGEVQQPGRNIPRALVGGMIVVMLIYCLANLAYFYALPFGEIVTSNSTAHREALPVASRAAQSFLGEYGGRIVALAFVVSALGALNGSILSNARVPYAMARDGVFFASQARLSKTTHVPVTSIMIQGVW